MTHAIVCDDLMKHFGPVRAVDGISFTVDAGEVVGFLGPNGAGKTTTIRMLLDIVRPTSGRVEVLGTDPRRAGAALRLRVGYVPGDLALYEHLTGRQLFELFAALRHQRDLTAYVEMAERLDVALDRPVGTLSRGNRQKIGVVQALAPGPELLVLDEPTSGLDPIVQREFRALVREAVDRGAAVLLSSHVLAEVQRTADRVAIIRSGRLVAVDPVRELEAKALRVVEIRFAGHVPAAAFEDLPGVREITVEGDLVRASVAGPVDALVKAASQFTVDSIAGHEADLEDVFLAYYGSTTDGVA
ncbi:MAG TPA: ABC transporter ATP-binding protein [Acidimicrobiales bacterium]|nr:ABC transporter ATP-binding protein [Acidimicrobiales bacterium]